MTRQEFENKLLNGKFTEEELRDIRWLEIKIDGSYEEIEHIEHIEDSELNRWSRNVQTIFKYKDKFYAFNWAQGLTELQEDYYYDQPYEVIKQEKQITITEWVPTKED